MTMTMDQQQNRHLGAIGFDNMHYSTPQPQFTNPWSAASSGASNSHLFATALGSNNAGFDALAKQQAARANSVSMPYSSIPASAPAIGTASGYPTGPYNQELLGLSQDLLTPRSTYEQTYSSAPSQSSSTFAPTSAPYIGTYAALSQQPQDEPRRLSHQSTASSTQSHTSFGDALDAGRGMVAMSQDLTTPRNIYGPRSDRGSPDAYGFPSSHSSHSSHSSISSASSYPYSYAGSVDSASVSDYSSQSESMEPMNSRTLPRPSGLAGASLPPAPQSMMGQFNSKVSTSTQKKHKCKVCDKRFTRPSSLQTHMYSHTGEKPYACEAEGCGRHFSVVSNLRRHRKVHKGERVTDHESPEGSWVSEK